MVDHVPIQLCNRSHGLSIKNCVCRLDGERGWLECPPDARGLLEPVEPPPQPRPLQDAPAYAGDLLEAPQTLDRQVMRAQARAMGYSGDFCDFCGSTKMLRTGTCLTCEDCSQSSGGCG